MPTNRLSFIAPAPRRRCAHALAAIMTPESPARNPIKTATTPAALNEVHERLDRFSGPSRAAAAGIQVVAATFAAALAWGPIAAIVVIALAGLAIVATGTGRRAAPA